MNNHMHIPAKLYRNGTPYYLKDHTNDVLNACIALRDELEKCAIRMGVTSNRVLLAIDILIDCIILHDLGKANGWFIGMILRILKSQRYRHEHISGHVIYIIFREFLIKKYADKYSSEFGDDIGVIAYYHIFHVVIQHHMKVNVDDGSSGDLKHEFCIPALVENSNSSDINTFYGTSTDVEWICDKLGYTESIVDLDISDLSSYWDEDAHDYHFRHAEKMMRKFDSGLSLFQFCKMGLIFCDGVGSSEFRMNQKDGRSVTTYIKQSLAKNSWKPIADILRNKKKTVEGVIGKRFKYTGAQSYVGKCGSRKLVVVADAGSGKSIQHYRFAKQFKPNYVIILAPTQGTATSQFSDYGLHTDGSALIHGNSDHALTAIHFKSQLNGDGIDVDQYRLDSDLYSLAAYDKHIIYATYDQFISAVMNNYSGVMYLPLLLNSVVVLDEPHAVERRMFDAFISLLNSCNVPVLLTTASLPMDRRKLLESHGYEIFEPRKQLGIGFKLDREQSSYKRYRLHYRESADGIVRSIIDDFNNNKQVLVVLNRVNSAVVLYDDLRRMLGTDSAVLDNNLLCYHGKFKNGDKTRKQQDVIDKAREYRLNGKGLIVVSTQVCEMALDIKMKIYTEECPMWSLIQRIGRSETRGIIKNGDVSDITIFNTLGCTWLMGTKDKEEYHYLPYIRDDVHDCVQSLGVSATKVTVFSQGDLADILSKMIPNSHFVDNTKLNMFADIIPCRKGKLRGESGYEGILESDLSEFTNYLTSNESDALFNAEGLKISIPLRNGSLPKGITSVVRDVSGMNLRIFSLDNTWTYDSDCGLHKISQI